MKKKIGISGSLRKNSFNTTLLRSANAFIPKGFSFELIDLGDVPLYNDDLATSNLPAPILNFRNCIEDSDGILIASPEYNHSITGVLKNAIDWASTNAIGNVLDKKPIAIMGASKGIFGTVRSQLHLRQVLFTVNAYVVQRPEVFVPKAGSKIDENGILIDAYTLNKINQLVIALIALIEQK